MAWNCRLSSQNVSNLIQKINQIIRNVHSESLAENPQFPERALAASVASKVYYYLEEFDESLRLALEAHDQFNLNEKTQYVETLINQCIEKYIKLKQEIVDNKSKSDSAPPVQIDNKMEIVIDKMFQTCFQDKKFK